MIVSFRDRETQELWNGRPSRFPADIQVRALNKLVQLNRATQLDDLRTPPSNRLEQLRGDRAGQWSMRINDQWRICFRWEDGNAREVEICDYH